jgi:hypothetical protein
MAFVRFSMFTAQVAETVIRDPAGSLYYGGALWTLWFPTASASWSRNVVDALNLDKANASWEGNAFVSVGGAAANIAAAGLVLVSLARAHSDAGRESGVPLRIWGYLYTVVLAFFAVTGLGLVFSYGFSDSIRAWGRYSIYLTGIGFLVMALLSSRIARYRIPKLMAVVAVSLSLLVAQSVADLGKNFRAEPIGLTNLEQELQGLVGSMENELADGCPILEIPLVPYPESPPINRKDDYTNLLPYLYSHDLRWSYGGLRGTKEGSWGFDLIDKPAELTEQAVKAGFCGALVDTFAFASQGEIQAWERILGERDLTSSTGRWVFFDLRGGAKESAVVSPVSGFSGLETLPDGSIFWWMVEPEGVLGVTGPRARVVPVRLRLAENPCGAVRVELDGKIHDIAGAKDIVVRTKLDGDGRGSLRIKALGPACTISGDPRALRVRLIDGLDGVRAAPGSTPTDW